MGDGNPYAMMPWEQYPQTQGMSAYDYLTNPSNFGSPMAGTAFGRVPNMFPQSPYAYMGGGAQPYMPMASFMPPQPTSFFPNVPALGPIGNIILQGIAKPVLGALTGQRDLGGSMQPFNAVQGAMAEMYQQDVLQSMGLTPNLSPKEWTAYRERDNQIKALQQEIDAAAKRPDASNPKMAEEIRQKRQELEQKSREQATDAAKMPSYDTTRRNFEDMFKSIAEGVHGGGKGILSRAEDDTRAKLLEESKDFQEREEKLKTLRNQQEELRQNQEKGVKVDTAAADRIAAQIAEAEKAQKAEVDDKAKPLAKERSLEIARRAREAADKVTKDLYDPGQAGQIARALVLQMGNTPLAEGLQNLAPEMFLAPGLMMAGRALSGGPFGISGKEGADLTQQVLAMMRGSEYSGKEGLDPRLTRGLRPSEIGDLTYQLAKRGLVTGEFAQGGEEERTAGRIKAVKASLEQYIPLIAELGGLFTKDVGDVDKLISNLEAMTGGMTQMMGAGDLQKVVREVRATAMITGIEPDKVAEITGIAEQEARQRGMAPGTGIAAAQMGLRLQEDIRVTRQSFGQQPFIGRRTPEELAQAGMALGLRGAASQTGQVIGGSLAALEIAGMQAGLSVEDMKNMTPEQLLSKVTAGRNVDEVDKQKMTRYFKALETGEDSEFMLQMTRDREGTTALIQRTLGLNRETALSVMYNPTTRNQVMAQKYQNVIAEAQGQEIINTIGRDITGVVGTTIGNDRLQQLGGVTFAQELVEAALVGQDPSVKAQNERIRNLLKNKGFTADEIKTLTPQLQNFIYTQTESSNWLTAGGKSVHGEGLSEYLSQLRDPTFRAMSQGRADAANAILDLDEMAGKAGLGQSSISQRVMTSLMSRDENGVKKTFEEILSGVPEEKRGKIREALEGLRTSYEEMQGEIGGTKGKSKEEVDRVSKAALAKFQKKTAEYKETMGEFFKVVGTPENLKKLADKNQEDEQKRKIEDETKTGKPQLVVFDPNTKIKFVFSDPSNKHKGEGNLTIG